MLREKSAGAVIFRKDAGTIKYLLLLHETGHWDFVKGNVEQGEDELETVKREAKEEAGIGDLKIIPGFKEIITYFYRREGSTIFKEVVFYLAETKTKDIKISYEHTGHDWLEFDAACKKITYKNSKETLKKAHAFLLDKKLNDFVKNNNQD